MENSIIKEMGEISTLALNARSCFYWNYSPYECYPTINLKAGDKLKLSWEARNNEMVVVVRNANVTSINVHGKNQEVEFKEKRKLK